MISRLRIEELVIRPTGSCRADRMPKMPRRMHTCGPSGHLTHSRALGRAPGFWPSCATLPIAPCVTRRIDQSVCEGKILAAYIEGWCDADPLKIAAATTEGYDFHDPLVGHFSKRNLPRYFALLRTRFAVFDKPGRAALAFTLRGPMLDACNGGCHRYWREAPHLGLVGDSQISMTPEGVAAESVAYDLNIACEILRSRHD